MKSNIDYGSLWRARAQLLSEYQESETIEKHINLLLIYVERRRTLYVRSHSQGTHTKNSSNAFAFVLSKFSLKSYNNKLGKQNRIKVRSANLGNQKHNYYKKL